MKACYVCDTPFQVLNSINHRYHFRGDIADIYIGNQFYNCKEIAKALDLEQLFDHVYVYDCPNYRGKTDYVISKIKEIIDIEDCMNSWLHTKNAELNSYDVIYMSLYTRFSYGLRELNPRAEVVFFEDGCGTYLGKEHEWSFETRKKIFRLLRKDFPDLRYSKLLVNNMDYYRINNPSKNESVDSLPQFNAEDRNLLGLLTRVFDVSKDDLYQHNRIVYLSAPNDNHIDKYWEIENRILMELNGINKSFVVRLHPRQKEAEYEDFTLDKNRLLWELIVLQHINNRSVLIASFSTAQLVPKLLYNLEPALIFTYPLYLSDTSSEVYNRIELAVENLKRIYSEPQKIAVIHKYSELKFCEYLT